jgi:hypothetical protein
MRVCKRPRGFVDSRSVHDSVAVVPIRGAVSVAPVTLKVPDVRTISTIAAEPAELLVNTKSSLLSVTVTPVLADSRLIRSRTALSGSRLVTEKLAVPLFPVRSKVAYRINT